MKKLTETFWNGDQSWNYRAHWSLANRCLRVTIRRNSYDDQSYQNVELFDGDQWNHIVDEPIAASFKDVSYVELELKPSKKEIFYKAEAEMLKTVTTIFTAHRV